VSECGGGGFDRDVFDRLPPVGTALFG
jgi:hypothetical protein